MSREGVERMLWGTALVAVLVVGVWLVAGSFSGAVAERQLDLPTDDNYIAPS